MTQMYDVEVAIGLIHAAKVIRRRQDERQRETNRLWMRKWRADEKNRQKEKQRENKRRRAATVALNESQSFRYRNSDLAFASRMNGLRFEDQPGAD